jgi:hypothetical protein
LNVPEFKLLLSIPTDIETVPLLVQKSDAETLLPPDKPVNETLAVASATQV